MKKPKKKAARIPLPDNCRHIMTSLCTTIADIVTTFSLSWVQARQTFYNEPVMLTPEKLELVRSICLNELKYALPVRITAIMSQPKSAATFALWVNTAARMLDSFRSLKAAGDQGFVISEMDPFLSSLLHMARSMDEVAEFMEQLHQKCPQFDGLFFRGTRFLESLSTDARLPDIRVPSSVDVFSLSPEDEKIYEQFSKE